MGTPAGAKRQRRWAPKRRTGCGSCKQRRLRCDETKPTCQRCVKDGFDCNWQVEPRRSRTSSLQPPRLASNGTSGRTLNGTYQEQSTGIVTGFTKQKTSQNVLSSSFLPTYTTPSSPYGKEADYVYLSYFLLKVAPLLSTTKAWRDLWQVTVPQSAWTSDSVRHALVAMAASYEGLKHNSDRQAVVLKQVNLAIGAFRQEKTLGILTASTSSTDSEDLDVALLLCRVLASVYQAQKHWRLASAHMGWGAKILRQAMIQSRASGSTQGASSMPLSNIVKTIAPSFMVVLNETLTEADMPVGAYLTDDNKKIWTELLRFRASFKEYFQKWMDQIWPSVNRELKAHLLTSWAMMNHAISSVLYPDLVFFSKQDPIKHASVIEEELRDSGKLYTLGHLTAFSDFLLKDIDAFLLNLPGLDSVAQLLAERLRTCLENYVVQARYLEPRMSAGSYWSNRPEPMCAVMVRLGLAREGEVLPNVFEVDKYGNQNPDKELLDADEQQNFYLEHVCPYRSGIVPARCFQDLCSLTDDSSLLPRPENDPT
jgi:hypothetical protein